MNSSHFWWTEKELWWNFDFVKEPTGTPSSVRTRRWTRWRLGSGRTPSSWKTCPASGEITFEFSLHWKLILLDSLYIILWKAVQSLPYGHQNCSLSRLCNLPSMQGLSTTMTSPAWPVTSPRSLSWRRLSQHLGRFGSSTFQCLIHIGTSFS